MNRKVHFLTPAGDSLFAFNQIQPLRKRNSKCKGITDFCRILQEPWEMQMSTIGRSIPAIAICLSLSLLPLRAQNVLTGGYDNARTNAALSETILNPSALRNGKFGRQFSLPADGQIYAQPLFETGIVAGGGKHNVVFVATMHNSVYAYDADAPGAPLWNVNLGPSIPASLWNGEEGAYTDLTPEIGILGTPVIDPSTGTLYAVAGTFENGRVIYRLHALSTSDGRERFGAPVQIAGQVTGTGDSGVNGSVQFVAGQHLQRPALLLVNGLVYIAFGSHADNAPYHGWMMAYAATDVTVQKAIFTSTPNGGGGSIWQSGRGPAADAEGNIYVATSNGTSDSRSNYSDSVLKLKTADLTLADWFAPSNVQLLDDTDSDLGTCGPVLIPGTRSLITGGKDGRLFVLHTDSLGHITADDSQIPQVFQAARFGIFNLALWNRQGGPVLYSHGGNSPVAAFKIAGDVIGHTPVSTSSSVFAVPFQGMTISANGGAPHSGILWMTTAALYPLPSAGILHAWDADDLSAELWNSAASGADALGTFVKFANPTVANGRVYVPAAGSVVVYGLTGANLSAGPIVSQVVNAASYAEGPVAPGEIVTVYGAQLGPRTPVAGVLDENGQLGPLLGGTQVTFNGVPAPLLYTSLNTVSAIVPTQLGPGATAVLQVSYQGRMSTALSLTISAATPAIFAADGSGAGTPLILADDGTAIASPGRLAPGSTVRVLVSGAGTVYPDDPIGGLASNGNALTAPVTAAINGVPAEVLFAGSIPGQLAGLAQVEIRLPAREEDTIATLALTIDGQSTSQQRITLPLAGLATLNPAHAPRLQR